MIEPQFSILFEKMLKQLNKNIKIINGINYYLIPVKTINDLKKLFNSQPQNLADESTDDEVEEDVDYYKPVF